MEFIPPHMIMFMIWKNIQHILASAHMTARNIIRVTSYLTKAEFAAKNQEARLRALGDRRVPTTAIVVSTLDPNWLVEIEIIAAAWQPRIHEIGD